eukprot:2041602-Pyramimonas_sp.AAC.1
MKRFSVVAFAAKTGPKSAPRRPKRPPRQPKTAPRGETGTDISRPPPQDDPRDPKSSRGRIGLPRCPKTSPKPHPRGSREASQ